MAFKVYIVTSGHSDGFYLTPSTHKEHGMFASRELAEIYIGARRGFRIRECTVCDSPPTRVLDVAALDWDGEVVVHNSRRVWDHEQTDQYLKVKVGPLPYHKDPEQLGHIVQVWGETTLGYDVLVNAARERLAERKAKRAAVLANKAQRDDA